MGTIGWRRLLLAGLTLTVATAPAKAATVAEDVAEISANACFPLASGALVLPEPTSPDHQATLAKLNLRQGIEKTTLDSLGPFVALVSRAIMASRKNGDSALVLATDGRLPGCRVILVGEPPVGAMDAIAAALTGPAFGWIAFPDMTDTRGQATKRIFLRRDAAGKPYLLNLVEMTGVPGNVKLYTTTIAVPPGVDLPAGF